MDGWMDGWMGGDLKTRIQSISDVKCTHSYVVLCILWCFLQTSKQILLIDRAAIEGNELVHGASDQRIYNMSHMHSSPNMVQLTFLSYFKFGQGQWSVDKGIQAQRSS